MISGIINEAHHRVLLICLYDTIFFATSDIAFEKINDLDIPTLLIRRFDQSDWS